MQSRFAMSYLRGPLTKAQIGQLMAPRKIEFEYEHVTFESHRTEPTETWTWNDHSLYDDAVPNDPKET